MSIARRSRRIVLVPNGLICTICLMAFCSSTVRSAGAATVFGGVGPITTELTDFQLSGGPVGMPLGSDPGNAMGDSVDGFMFVQSTIEIRESADKQSLGQAFISPLEPSFAAFAGEGGGGGSTINNGDPVLVESFFDVFFDVTFTDVDSRPGRDYATGTPTIQINGLGPANMSLGGPEGGGVIAIADTSKPNYGVLPPTGEAYIGHFNIVVDLSDVFGQTVDINQNGDPDVLKFTLATHQVGDVTNTFIDGADLVDEFNSNLDLNGAILDSLADPPFTISLSGPTTARQQILVSAALVPEASTWAWWSIMAVTLAIAGSWRRRQGL